MAIFVGIYVFELLLPEVTSLKEKRRIVKSLKDRISKRFKMSIAETDYQDKWQRTQLGLAKIASEKAVLEDLYDHVDRLLGQDVRIQIISRNKRIV